MKLDIDCIRDILLYVEDNTTFSKEINFCSDSIPVELEQYGFEKLYYHLRYCDESGLLHNFRIFEEDEIEIPYLTPLGHEFVANIRNDQFFKKLKAVAIKIGISSVTGFIQMASQQSLDKITNIFTQ